MWPSSFRARGSHRLYEKALEAAGVPTCVYRGLGFAEADEVQDVLALIRFLAQPASELRAAALLRSRLLRISDTGLLVLAGNLSAALADERPPPPSPISIPMIGACWILARRDMRRWLALVDNMPPAELIERELQDTAYACELRGRGAPQALANLRRLRGLVRRIQNRGYATMARVAEQLERLSAGMANAAVEARGAVSLMTVHAAKGLEFPVVFLVDIGRGTRADTPPVRVAAGRGDRRPHVTVWAPPQRGRRHGTAPRARGGQASAVRGADTGPQPPVSRGRHPPGRAPRSVATALAASCRRGCSARSTTLEPRRPSVWWRGRRRGWRRTTSWSAPTAEPPSPAEEEM